jgi:hypothetical protein
MKIFVFEFWKNGHATKGEWKFLNFIFEIKKNGYTIREKWKN